MRKNVIVWLSVLVILPIMLGSCVMPAAPAQPPAAQPTEAPQAEAAQPAAEGATKRIGVTLFTRAHKFYQDMEKTWLEEAPKYGYELLIQSAEFDAATQTSQVENFIQQKVDAIILCGVDPQGMIPAVESANKAGIPVVTVDGPVSGGDIVTFIGTDNFGGGLIAGEAAKQYINEELGGKANVAIIDFPQSAVVCVARVNGFKKALEGMEGVTFVAQQDGGAQREKAMSVMENILSANPDVDVVFGINDDTILGAIAGAKAAGRDQDIAFFGYDGTPEAAELLATGNSPLKADVAQQPVLIAKTALEVLKGVFEGKTYPPESPVAPILVTQENAADFMEK